MSWILILFIVWGFLVCKVIGDWCCIQRIAEPNLNFDIKMLTNKFLFKNVCLRCTPTHPLHNTCIHNLAVDGWLKFIEIIMKSVKNLFSRKSCYVFTVLFFFALFANQSYVSLRKFTIGRTRYQTDYRVNIFCSNKIICKSI